MSGRPKDTPQHGYWYTPYGGEREWREGPRCECGGACEQEKLKPIEEAEENEPIARVVCTACGKVQVMFLKPCTEAIELGRKLAKRYDW